jgi:hypothetical protein
VLTWHCGITCISRGEASVTSKRKVSFAGCLGLSASDGVGTGWLTSTALQYATSRNGPWHGLSNTGITVGGTCGHDGNRFSSSATAKVNAAYYRVYYPGHSATSSDGYSGFHAVSGPVVYLKVP